MDKHESSFSRKEIGLLMFLLICFILLSFEDNPFVNLDLDIKKRISDFGFLFTIIGLSLYLYSDI